MHGLANSCQFRDPANKEWQKLIYKTEASWYEGQHPQSFSTYQQFGKSLIDRLTKLGKESKEEFGSLISLTDQFTSGHDSAHH